MQEENDAKFILIISHKVEMQMIIFTFIGRFVLYLWRGDVEYFSDLGIEFLDVGESVDAACRTPVGQLGVEDESRSWVFWWPLWWRWRRRKWRCCGLCTPLRLALGLLLLHGLSPCCLGVLRAHSLPVLHRAPVQVWSSSGSPVNALLWQREELCPSPRLADQPPTARRTEMN